jgi:fluoride exporter
MPAIMRFMHHPPSFAGFTNGKTVALSSRPLAVADTGPVSLPRPSMNLLITYLVIAVGSALGGVARYGCGLLAVGLWGPSFPWGTIIINLAGSFVIGGFATLTAPDGRVYVSPLGRQFVMVGLCGGYTTFSAFSLETLELLQRGRPLGAFAYAGLTLLLGLAAVWLGDVIARKVNESPQPGRTTS